MTTLINPISPIPVDPDAYVRGAVFAMGVFSGLAAYSLYLRRYVAGALFLVLVVAWYVGLEQAKTSGLIPRA